MKTKPLEKIISLSNLIAADTMLFIYLLEEHKIYFPLVELIFNKMESGKIKIVSSIISYLETLSSSRLNSQKITLYKEFFQKTKNLHLCKIDWEIADMGAFIRRTYGLRTPDALQMATAIVSKADFFISNDPSFKKVKEIKNLVLKDFV